MASETPRGNNREWTVAEVRTLREQANLGAQGLAILLGRSVKSVETAAARNRISLRRSGERRGKILGQPRTGRWLDQSGDPARLSAIRSDAIDGVVDIAELEARIREKVHGPRRPICPACGQRDQEKPSTGLCEPCHLRELARAHRDEIDRREARRDLWQARQSKHRAKRTGE